SCRCPAPLVGPGGGVVEHLVEGHGPAPGDVVGGGGEHVAAEGGAGRLQPPGQLGALVVAAAGSSPRCR
ncbi:MAG TPA: hypothetical protein VG499_05955, partial [Actinomycetota bacterium]|nr:hypothetical protein [Actinomycetota bacterium]